MCNDVMPDRGNDGTGWTVESSCSYGTLTSDIGPTWTCQEAPGCVFGGGNRVYLSIICRFPTVV
jgi:hypothetical protein